MNGSGSKLKISVPLGNVCRNNFGNKLSSCIPMQFESIQKWVSGFRETYIVQKVVLDSQ